MICIFLTQFSTLEKEKNEPSKGKKTQKQYDKMLKERERKIKIEERVISSLKVTKQQSRTNETPIEKWSTMKPESKEKKPKVLSSLKDINTSSSISKKSKPANVSNENGNEMNTDEYKKKIEELKKQGFEELFPEINRIPSIPMVEETMIKNFISKLMNHQEH